MGKINYKGKNIVVTGASKGIGRSIALKLAHQGANLYLMARNKSDLEKVKKEVAAIDSNIVCEVYSVDVSKHKEVKECAGKIIKSCKQVDGVISNAGAAMTGYFSELDVEHFIKSQEVKYLGAVFVTKEFEPYLAKGGFLVYTSSVLGYMGIIGYSTYVGPNFSLMGLAYTMEQELLGRDVHVAVLCPPDTDTPGFQEEQKTKPYETHKLSEKANLMSPDDVASKFLTKLSKKKFLITVNFESYLYYFLMGKMNRFTRWVMKMMVRSFQKEKLKQAPDSGN